MPSEKVIVSAEEIESIVPEVNAPPTVFKRLPPPIPLWARLALCVLIPVLPLLCLVAIILRVVARTQPPRVRYAIASLLTTLLIVSGFLTSLATVLVVSFVPIPAMVNNGLPTLDERADFPVLSSGNVLSTSEASSKLKPLVIVISPATRLWNRQYVASQSFGAGVLLEATPNGYLFATANHVVGHAPAASGSPAHIMVATAADIWSNAEVVATAAPLDLALVWVPRHTGTAKFIQPLAAPTDGEDVFVIGHPEGLKYTLSTGIVSGLRDDTIQISAAISPGNSGGPVYDAHGLLIGIVSSKYDNNRDANAENLGFAARAQMLRDVSRWSFYGAGRQELEGYLGDLQKMESGAPTDATPKAQAGRS